MTFCRRWSRFRRFVSIKNKRVSFRNMGKGSVRSDLNIFFRNVALGFAGASILTLPMLFTKPAMASNITAHGVSPQTKITSDASNSIFRITTTNIKGENAFNAFSNFDLSAGHTANLYLPTNTKNLINFVNNRINVDGTLNSIKNNTIGGNLYFLSSQGLIVGKTGVVNAGSFFAATPHEDYFEKYFKTNTFSIADNDPFVERLLDKKFVNRNEISFNSGITLAQNGQITINGRINAFNQIGLYAGGSTKGEDNVYTGGVNIGKDAVLNTLNFSDFSSVVNVSNLKAINESGNSTKLNSLDSLAFVEKEGGIELVAVADNTHSLNIVKEITGLKESKDKFADARISIDGNIKSRRDIKAETIATNGQFFLRGFEVDPNNASYNDGSSVATINSIIEVENNSNLNAANDLNLEAISRNVFEIDGGLTSDIKLEFLGLQNKLIDFDANIRALDTKSKIKIAEKAKLNAVNNLTLLSDAYASTGIENLDEGAQFSFFVPKKIRKVIPSQAFVYAKANVSSEVEIDGNLTTSNISNFGNISIKAVSENNIAADSIVQVANDNQSSLALVYADVKTSSKVNLNNNSKVISSGNLDISAESTSDVSTSAIAESGNEAIAAAALNITNFDSNANVFVNGFLESKNSTGSLSIQALNTIAENQSIAETKLGSFDVMQQFEDKAKDVIKNLFESSELLSKFKELLPEEESLKLDAAGALLINKGNHDSNIFVDGNKTIKSAGEVSLFAKTLIEDTQLRSSTVTSAGENSSNAENTIGAAVLYSDISNNSNVIINDNSTNSEKTIEGKNVNINSEVIVEYGRINSMIDNVLEAVEILKEHCSEYRQRTLLNQVKDTFSNIKSELSVNAISGINGLDFLQSFKNKLEQFTNAYDILQSLMNEEKKVVQYASDIVTNALDFASYENSFNISVATKVKHQ